LIVINNPFHTKKPSKEGFFLQWSVERTHTEVKNIQ